MLRTRTGRVVEFVVVAVFGIVACAAGVSGAPVIRPSQPEAARPPASGAAQREAPQGPVIGTPRVNPDAQALAVFMDNVKKYVALHKKLEAKLPKLPKDATPQQIDQSQRALGRLIQQARAGAKQGDIFEKRSRAVFRRLLLGVFGGPDGKQLIASIMDENVGPIKLEVNGRYPDTVPLSTMPPQVLESLPKLPEELQYRFIGRRLILFDEHAHLVADYIENALPS
jgi:hypothetical protein